LQAEKLAGLPETIREDVRLALETAAEQRSEVQTYLVEKLAGLVAVAEADIDAALSEEEKAQLEQLTTQLTEAQNSVPTPDAYRMIALEDICWALLNTNEFLFQH
jgi:hypothetical protein